MNIIVFGATGPLGRHGPLTRRLRAQPRLRITIRDSVSRADVAEFVLTELEHGNHLLSAPTVAAT